MAFFPFPWRVDETRSELREPAYPAMLEQPVFGKFVVVGVGFDGSLANIDSLTM